MNSAISTTKRCQILGFADLDAPVKSGDNPLLRRKGRALASGSVPNGDEAGRLPTLRRVVPTVCEDRANTTRQTVASVATKHPLNWAFQDAASPDADACRRRG